MDTREVFRIFLKRLPIFLVITIIITLLSFVYTYFVQSDKYSASALMIIGMKQSNDSDKALTLNDITINSKLVNPYRVLCKSDRILSQVIKEVDLPLSVEQLSKKITVTSEAQTELIKISVIDNDPQTAADIANSLTSVFVKEIPLIMNLDNVQIIDQAKTPEYPVSPNRPLNVLVGFMIGALLGLCVIFIIDYFDDTVKSTDILSEIFDKPIIGTVPSLEIIKVGSDIK